MASFFRPAMISTSASWILSRSSRRRFRSASLISSIARV